METFCFKPSKFYYKILLIKETFNVYVNSKLMIIFNLKLGANVFIWRLVGLISHLVTKFN